MIEYCNCGRPTRSHDKGAECDKPRVRMVDGVPVEVPLVQTDAPDDGEHAGRSPHNGVRDVEPLQ